MQKLAVYCIIVKKLRKDKNDCILQNAVKLKPLYLLRFPQRELIARLYIEALLTMNMRSYHFR